MRPQLIFDILDGDSVLSDLGVATIRESQSVDFRLNGDYFLTIKMEEEIAPPGVIPFGPRMMTIAVHHSWDKDRDYGPLSVILNRIDELLLPIEQQTGGDGVRVAQVKRGSRSGNMVDEGYKTITRWSTYRVSYDEFAA